MVVVPGAFRATMQLDLGIGYSPGARGVYVYVYEACLSDSTAHPQTELVFSNKHCAPAERRDIRHKFCSVQVEGRAWHFTSAEHSACRTNWKR